MKANAIMEEKKEDLKRMSIHVLLKTDTYGSLEAIVDNIAKYEYVSLIKYYVR